MIIFSTAQCLSSHGRKLIFFLFLFCVLFSSPSFLNIWKEGHCYDLSDNTRSRLLPTSQVMILSPRVDIVGNKSAIWKPLAWFLEGG
jgi:hypothetical protein